MQGEIDNSPILVGYFNTSLSVMARMTRQKINKEIEDLDNIINQTRSNNIYRTLHPITE